MHRILVIFHWLLLSSLIACSPSLRAPASFEYYVYRFDPPAIVQLSADDVPLREIPMTAPAGCSLSGLFPAPHGGNMAVEWNCPFGQAVVLLDTATAVFKQAVTDSDSHVLAWASDGRSLYLKVNAVNHPQVLHFYLDGTRDVLPINGLTYDLSPRPNGSGFISSFSLGMGLGSQMDFARSDGGYPQPVNSDPQYYLSLARWSPDGNQVAFIKIPDSPTPFTVGELWLMSADGSHARKLADADSGHGFAPAWSPDGTRIAFVVRENPADSTADQSAGALVSNIHVVNVHDGRETPLTKFTLTSVGAPVWSPDGGQVAVTIVMNDKMSVVLVDAITGTTRQVLAAGSCCSAWIRK